MKRRIVKQGNSTLTISLPASWTKQQDLKDKDEVDVEERDEGLYIGARKLPAPRSISVDLTGFNNNLIRRYLYSLYKQGYEEIELTFSDFTVDKNNKKIDTLRYIQEIVNHLFGVEIVDQKKNFCRIKDLTGVLEDEFDRMLSRIIFSLSTIFSSFKDFLKKGLTNEDILYQHEVIEKFSIYCHRLLNKRIHPKATIYYNFIFDLKFSADILGYLSREIYEKRIKVTEQDINIFKQVSDIFDRFFKLYHKFDKEKLMDIVVTRRKIYDEINQVKFKSYALLVIRLSTLLGLMANLTENLLEIKI